MILACSAPLAGYYQYLTSSDPLWRSMLSQYVNAGVWTPPPPLLVVLLGAPLVLAAIRLQGLAWDHAGTRFAACWALIGVVIIYVPTVFQMKLLAALQVPLAILAADLWCARLAPGDRRVDGAARSAPRAAAWVPALVLALLVLPTNVYLLAWRLIELRRPASDLYVTADESAALDALAVTTGPDDVALAVESVGRWVPNQGGTRAFLAHWAMTNHYLERRDARRSLLLGRGRRRLAAAAARRQRRDLRGVDRSPPRSRRHVLAGPVAALRAGLRGADRRRVQGARRRAAAVSRA